MKRILLTSTALTMVAGIASADVSVAGSFKLGFNDTSATTGDNNYGVYNDAGLTFAMSSVMDSGMTAGITVDLNQGAAATPVAPYANDTLNNGSDKYTLSLASDGLNVTFGSTEYSAKANFKAAGDMATDTWSNQNDSGGNVLRADVTLGGLAVSAAALVTPGAQASPNAVSISVGGSLGGATYVIANEGSVMGISVATAMGGSTLTSAYTTDGTDTSTGVKIAYPMGAITTTASYVMESATATGDAWNVAAVYAAGGSTVTFKTDEATQNSVEGTMTMGAATVSAGLADNLEDMYLAVSNPLGGGATIMASYAIDGTGSGDAKDEVGAGDWQEGLTVELSFKF